MAFTLKINGTPHEVDVDSDTTLLWVLRDVLGMTGTKFGCGQALCGACTVDLHGQPVRSCRTPVDNVGDSAITTIEAIGQAPQVVDADTALGISSRPRMLRYRPSVRGRSIGSLNGRELNGLHLEWITKEPKMWNVLHFSQEQPLAFS